VDARDLVEALARAGRTLAVAESFTGGRLADALTDVPGSSRAFVGAVVAYTNEAKRGLLDVAEGDLLLHGAASGEVALALARGARRRLGADYALATTGIAGPTGATPAKPVGLSYVAAAGPRAERVDARIHPGARPDVKRAAVDQALALLADLLRAEGIL
jgi:nicotinamide-nucleotide amidase